MVKPHAGDAKRASYILFDCESRTNLRLSYFNQWFNQPHEFRQVSIRNLVAFMKALVFYIRLKKGT